MHVKSTLISAAIIISSAVLLGSAPVQAQDRPTKEGDRLRQLCDGGGTNLPWCGVPYSSTRECVYQSIAQCETDMRPLGGNCEPRD